MPKMLFFLIFLSTSTVSANLFNYRLHESNDPEVNKCIEDAMSAIMKETCVYFEEAEEGQESITFLQSGQCSWQASNKTVHLSPNCITDETCFEILGKVADVHQPKHHISRHINIKFNCTEKCTIECENGGSVNEDCSCSCGYGFGGERCETLSRSASFSDQSCGIINAEEQGHISLSSYPDSHTDATFCQWFIKSDDPWGVIEIDFDDFDLDNEELPPNQHCHDLLNIFGAGDSVQNPIPCDAGKPSRIRSISNWILIELRTNPWPIRKHKGPSIRYTKVHIPQGIKSFSEEMTASTSITTSFSVFTLCLFRFL